jgi:hypothetical protein
LPTVETLWFLTHSPRDSPAAQSDELDVGKSVKRREDALAPPADADQPQGYGIRSSLYDSWAQLKNLLRPSSSEMTG